MVPKVHRTNFEFVTIAINGSASGNIVKNYNSEDCCLESIRFPYRLLSIVVRSVGDDTYAALCSHTFQAPTQAQHFTVLDWRVLSSSSPFIALDVFLFRPALGRLFLFQYLKCEGRLVKMTVHHNIGQSILLGVIMGGIYCSLFIQRSNKASEVKHC